MEILTVLLDNKDLIDICRSFTLIIGNIITILGVPVGIFVYNRNKRKERKLREYEIYNKLDERFNDYLRICLLNPELDIFEIPMCHFSSDVSTIENKVSRQEVIAFTMLVSIFERYYISIRSCDAKKEQVKSIAEWESYIKLWFTQPRFCEAWEHINIQNQLERVGLKEESAYNKEFVAEMNKINESLHPRSSAEVNEQCKLTLFERVRRKVKTFLARCSLQ